MQKTLSTALSLFAAGMMSLGNAQAQQTPAAKVQPTPAAGTPKAGTKAGSAGTKQASPAPKLALIDGQWSGEANFDVPLAGASSSTNEFSFTVKNNLLTGSGRIPIHFSCSDTSAAASAMKKSMQESSPGSKVTLVLPGKENMRGSVSTDTSLVADFSKVMHSSGNNSFGASFPIELQAKTYRIIVKGTFLSGISASGSISVTSSSCKAPTVYTWKASPQSVEGTGAAAPPLATTRDKFSYALGMNLGTNLHKQSVEVDPDILARGLKDGLAGGKTQLTEDEAHAALLEAQNELRKQMEEKMKLTAETNKKGGDAFLAANKTKDGVVVLPSGLQYKVLTQGTGPKPTTSDTVVCNYRGTLIDGTEFDSSYKRGQPVTFPINGVIKGWAEALPLMPVGSKWRLFIPTELAYGEHSPGAEIGPNSTLIFEVELLSIQDQNAQKSPVKVPDQAPEKAADPSGDKK
jgi:FKBP-type peptidyl-prolyl cis-trans isomerase FklB